LEGLKGIYVGSDHQKIRETEILSINAMMGGNEVGAGGLYPGFWSPPDSVCTPLKQQIRIQKIASIIA